MILNQVSDLEMKLISKTREFVSELNHERPRNKKNRKAYFIRTYEHPKRNRITIEIKQHRFLNKKIASVTYWNNAEEGKLFFSGNYRLVENEHINHKYMDYITKEIPEIAGRIKD